MDFIKENQPQTFVLDLSAVIMMDMDGNRILLKLAKELHRKSRQVLLVNVGTDNRKLMRKTGTLEEIGEDNIYRTVRAAVADTQKSAGEREVEPIR